MKSAVPELTVKLECRSEASGRETVDPSLRHKIRPLVASDWKNGMEFRKGDEVDVRDRVYGLWYSTTAVHVLSYNRYRINWESSIENHVFRRTLPKVLASYVRSRTKKVLHPLAEDLLDHIARSLLESAKYRLLHGDVAAQKRIDDRY